MHEFGVKKRGVISTYLKFTLALIMLKSYSLSVFSDQSLINVLYHCWAFINKAGVKLY
jgi:hypothetical protein